MNDMEVILALNKQHLRKRINAAKFCSEIRDIAGKRRMLSGLANVVSVP